MSDRVHVALDGLGRLDEHGLRLLDSLFTGLQLAVQLRLEKIGADAQQVQAKRRSQFDAQLDRFRLAGEAVLQLVDEGLALDQAVARVSGGWDIPLLTVRSWADRVARDRQQAEREQRSQVVHQLAAEGLSNSQIGERLGLHPVTVSKALRVEVDRRRRSAPPPPVAPLSGRRRRGGSDDV
jgi:hypothetical protein